MGSKIDAKDKVLTLPTYTAEKQDPDEKEASKRKTTLKNIIHEYGEVSTAHGIPRIISSERWWAKLFWLIVSFGLAVLFGYQGYGLLKDFFSWPYTTKIDVISKSKVEFPAVTVCNLNRLRRSKLFGTRYDGIIEIDSPWNDERDDFWPSANSEWDNWRSNSSSGNIEEATTTATYDSRSMDNSSSSDGGNGAPSWWEDLFESHEWFDLDNYDSISASTLPSYIDDLLDDIADFFEFSSYYSESISSDIYDWDDIGESDWAEFYNRSKNDDYSDIAEIMNPTREELEEFGHQAEDFILQCNFDKRRCSYNDFRQFQNNLYGNCYTFNHGFDNETVHSTSKSGAQFGLHLTLFIEQPEYVGLFSPESGVRVSVHPAHVQPFPENEGITAATGMATSISIRQTRIRRLGGKYTKPYCTKDGFESLGSSEHLIRSEVPYTSLACNTLCLQEELHHRCDCVTDVLIDAPKCSFVNITQRRCRQIVQKKFSENKIECNCPDVCDETTYPMSVSSALWPSDRYENHLYRRLARSNDNAASTLKDVEETRKNLVRLRIFDEELNYQEIKQQQAWSIESISGAVGGLMGLYLGFSAVSILEIIILLFKMMAYFGTCGFVNFKK